MIAANADAATGLADMITANADVATESADTTTANADTATANADAAVANADTATANVGAVEANASTAAVRAPVAVQLVPLQDDDREQFILDNQEAFLYGATQEFGMRDDHFEEDGQIIARATIEASIDRDNAEAYRIVLDGKKVGGLVLFIDPQKREGELDLLFVSPRAHSKGIGQAAWKAVEELHPEIRAWELVTPYFEKRNIHFYVNRLGFHIVEFFNEYHPDPNEPAEHAELHEESDGMFRFRKEMPSV